MQQTTVKIPSELFALAESSRFEGVYDKPTLESGPDTYRFEEPLAWAVDITNTGSALLVTGSVRGTGVCACSRCLADVTCDFDGKIEGYYLIEGQGEPDEWEEDEVGEDEFDVLPDDHMVDIEPLLQAALIVDAPAIPLCREDCAGLCPQCGADLNKGPCGCGEDADIAAFERKANPFSVLENYTFD